MEEAPRRWRKERPMPLAATVRYAIVASGLVGLFAIPALWFGCEVPRLESVSADPASSSRQPVSSAEQTPSQAGDPIASADPAPSAPTPVAACPAGMVLVEGEYCPEVEQRCLEWIDDPFKYPYARCAKFEQPSRCKAPTKHMRFCMDRLEASDASGMPIADVSWTHASNTCKALGKRLCQEHEWVFACEGQQMLPYPYGYNRDASICNFEKDNLVEKGEMVDYRQPVDSNPKCVSPFGVQNMVGNIDEWVVLDNAHWAGGRKMMSGLKGGWWGPLRNRCRPVTVDHDEYFHELQTGFRCCAESK